MMDHGLGGIGYVELLVILSMATMALALTVLPFWMIFRKAGFSPYLSLGMLLPVVNVILLFYLAFAQWPALRR